MMQKGMFLHTRRPIAPGQGPVKLVMKTVGICLFVGLVLAYCHTLIGACMSGIH
jgi:4-hydroxybenzoate polyprenyltransferase